MQLVMAISEPSIERMKCAPDNDEGRRTAAFCDTEISPWYTRIHATRYFVISRILLRHRQKEFERELKNRSHESKLLLALLNKNEFMFDSCSPWP